jgi:hypothetical protein
MSQLMRKLHQVRGNRSEFDLLKNVTFQQHKFDGDVGKFI